MLKEYEFTFQGIGKDGAVSVIDGEHMTVKVVGKRVSFSAYGKVQTLSGKAINHGVVTAISRNKQEVATV